MRMRADDKDAADRGLVEQFAADSFHHRSRRPAAEVERNNRQAFLARFDDDGTGEKRVKGSFGRLVVPRP